MNRQKESFVKLIRDDIPEMFKSFSKDDFNVNGFEVSYSLFPIVLNSYLEENGTLFVPVKSICKIKNTMTGEEQEFVIDLLNLPVYTDLGFRIKGNNKQVLDLYDRFLGWTHTLKLDAKTTDVNGDPIRLVMAKLSAVGKSSLCFSAKGSSIRITNGKGYTSAYKFFRAITNYSREDLLEIFGYDNPYIVSAFSDRGQNEENLSKNDCIKDVTEMLVGENNRLSSSAEMIREINKRLFNRQYLNLGTAQHLKLSKISSFKNRAIHKSLAEDITILGKEYKKGYILDEDILSKIDNLPIDTLKVKHAGKIYNLKKFSIFNFRALEYILAEDVDDLKFEKGRKLSLDDLNKLNATNRQELLVKENEKGNAIKMVRRTSADVLSVDDLFTTFSIFMDNVNGFDSYDNQYELTNRVVVPYSTLALDYLSENFFKCTETITRSLSLLDSSNSPMLASGNFDSKINLNALIDKIANIDNKTSQMSDLNNVLSYTSKDYKITSDISDKNTITPDMTRVQDLQLGRLDAIDAPESGKIGVVHFRTLLAKEDSTGKLLAPYLPVKNGEVISDDPQFLTADEEIDQYIAEWNETFKNEDGSPKQYTKARYNGNVITVAVNQITLKEYSSLQNMSPARGMIPFMNHSAPKRLTMGSNHGKQATQIIFSERAILCTGVESITGVGVYTAKDILNTFYEDNVESYSELIMHKSKILKSDLKLVSISESKYMRELTFEIEYMKGLNLEGETQCGFITKWAIPYFQLNSDKGFFSFRINTDVENNCYHYDDIVCYNTGYDKNVKHTDILSGYGGLKIDKQTFDTGIGIGKNLVVAVKTYGSTTIDDSITISSDLWYGETLTSVVLTRIEVELFNKNGYKEKFGVNLESNTLDVSHINENGLPKIGTILKPNDIVVCKIGYSDNKIKSCNRSLRKNEHGQVVSAEIKVKDSKTYAEVILADKADIRPGDKLSGRYGNKGVIAKIVPAEEMPYDPETGKRADIVINPLGVPSRMNISQLIELPLAFGAMLRGEKNEREEVIVVPPYSEKGLEYVEQIQEEMDVHPKMLIDGRTGEYYKRPINLGVMYMFKLVHMVGKKMHAIGLNAPVDPVFLQPRKGAKADGGQAFGEMESWCLMASGANKVLQEIYSIQSDDISNMEKVTENWKNEQNKFNWTGNNSNDDVIKAFLYSMLVEIKSNEDGNYEYLPLTDDSIKGLSAIPVTDFKSLHSSAIFGVGTDNKAHANMRKKWSYINLNTKIVSPLFVNKGHLCSMIIIDKYDKSGHARDKMSTNMANDIIKGKRVVKKDSLEMSYPVICTEDYIESVGADSSDYLYGMEALIAIFESYDLNNSKTFLELKLNESPIAKEKGSAYRKYLKIYRSVATFIEKGRSLSDYVISAYPIMPAAFRPNIELSTQQKIPDFDYYYKNLIEKVRNANDTNKANRDLEIYNAICRFQGIVSDSKQNSKDSDYQNLYSWFLGKGNDNSHGKIREKVQSKRTFCSGRSVIIPVSNIQDMLPTQLGVPMSMLVTMYEEPLCSYIKEILGEVSASEKVIKRAMRSIADNDFERFTKCARSLSSDADIAGLFRNLKDAARSFFEGEKSSNVDENGDPIWIRTPQIVLAGRQPSLHEFSIRGYYVKMVDTMAIQIHPLVCTGYNADFDGDQMWVKACITEESKREAIAKLSPRYGVVNPKDSGLILELNQDVCLGIYGATMLKDNAIGIKSNVFENDIRIYSGIGQIELDVDTGACELYDLVCYVHKNGNKYLSTAGRILFNSNLPNGFTDNPFSNPLKITTVDFQGNPVEFSDSFKDLRYDGLIAKKGGVRKELTYCSLSKICEDLFNEDPEHCIFSFQKLMIFGFKYSDMIGVSLSFDDMKEHSSDESFDNECIEKIDLFEDKRNAKLISENEFRSLCNKAESSKSIQKNNKKADIMRLAENDSSLVDKDYQEGLISDNSRKEMIANIYKNANAKIQAGLIESLNRNNNLFIIMDSGARGNMGQIMQTLGALGILQKTKTEDLETPVTHSYAEGLSSFEVHLASYSARTGIASTQNETRTAGHATRSAVYMAGGLKIDRNDCGKSDWWFDVKYGERKDTVLLKPSRDYFDKKLLGLNLSQNDPNYDILASTLNNGCISEESFPVLEEHGFSQIIYLDDSKNEKFFDVTIDSIKGAELDCDPDATKYLKKFLKFDRLNQNCINEIEKMHLSEIKTTFGTFLFKYKMAKMDRSLLLGREARKLPYLAKAKDLEGNDIEVITKKTLDYIEDNVIKRVEARIFLDCKCKGNCICSRCYGLKYENHKLPEIGENVGIVSAQSIGEPAAQLTMSLFHQGGAAGASVDGGVKVFNSLLDGSVPNAAQSKAVLAKNEGYVSVQEVDEKSFISIMPPNSNSSRCIMCKAENDMVCPLKDGNCGHCTIDSLVDNNKLIVKNGEYVHVGDSITRGYVLPDEIDGSADNMNASKVVRLKQIAWLENYFYTFSESNISINARHFEVFSRLQNFAVTILQSNNEKFKIGEVYDFSEVEGVPGIEFSMDTLKKVEVTNRYGGTTTALSFEYVMDTLSNAVVDCVEDSNSTPIGAIYTGTDLVTMEPKKFITNHVSKHLDEEDNTHKNVSKFKYVEEASDDNPFSNLGNLDIASLDVFGNDSMTIKDDEEEVSRSIDGEISESSTNDYELNEEYTGDIEMPESSDSDIEELDLFSETSTSNIIDFAEKSIDIPEESDADDWSLKVADGLFEASDDEFSDEFDSEGLSAELTENIIESAENLQLGIDALEGNGETEKTSNESNNNSDDSIGSLSLF